MYCTQCKHNERTGTLPCQRFYKNVNQTASLPALPNNNSVTLTAAEAGRDVG